MITRKIKKSTRQLFSDLYDLGNVLGTPVYVVGGFVRDLLLGTENKDIDFVVLDDALRFARRFKRKHPASSLQ